MGTPLAEFLAASAAVDRDHPAVRRLAEEIRRSTEIETVRTAFEVVRDRYPHSYDIGATEVSVSGSDVLRHGHGICYAKSHLLTDLGRWHRLDARGNKPGIDTVFDLDCERLAFAVRPERGECTFDGIFAEPIAGVMQALRDSGSVAELDRRLPADVA